MEKDEKYKVEVEVCKSLTKILLALPPFPWFRVAVVDGEYSKKELITLKLMLDAYTRVYFKLDKPFKFGEE